MAAYVITDLDVFDIARYLDYQCAVRPLLAGVGARYLVRGGTCKVYEGDCQTGRILVIEFPSLQAVDEFYESEQYQALEDQRQACSSARIIAVEGL